MLQDDRDRLMRVETVVYGLKDSVEKVVESHNDRLAKVEKTQEQHSTHFKWLWTISSALVIGVCSALGIKIH